MFLLLFLAVILLSRLNGDGNIADEQSPSEEYAVAHDDLDAANGGTNGANAEGDRFSETDGTDALPTSRTRLTREAIYEQTLSSTVWIISRLPDDQAATGTGCVIDKNEGIVLTNDHVVLDATDVRVFFPDVNSAGNVIVERDHYLQNVTPIRGHVIGADRNRDLALIKLDSPMRNATDITLASSSSRPGQNVHTVGNPGTSGGLWIYTSGTVRQVYHARIETNDGREIDAKVIETQNPTNQGDSGGPVVNDFGELVAITQSYSKEARLMSICIDISEISAFARKVLDNLR